MFARTPWTILIVLRALQSFSQLLNNFLLLWHFTAFSFKFYLWLANTPLTGTQKAFLLLFFFPAKNPLCFYSFRLTRWRDSKDSDSKWRCLRVPWVSGNNKPGTGISFILIREHNYERQSSLIRMGDEIIVICLIILILTGEFILWTSQIWGKWTISSI